jgi:hypothetical protein
MKITTTEIRFALSNIAILAKMASRGSMIQSMRGFAGEPREPWQGGDDDEENDSAPQLPIEGAMAILSARAEMLAATLKVDDAEMLDEVRMLCGAVLEIVERQVGFHGKGTIEHLAWGTAAKSLAVVYEHGHSENIDQTSSGPLSTQHFAIQFGISGDSLPPRLENFLEWMMNSGDSGNDLLGDDDLS